MGQRDDERSGKSGIRIYVREDQVQVLELTLEPELELKIINDNRI
jgi:hypothetical protein